MSAALIPSRIRTIAPWVDGCLPFARGVTPVPCLMWPGKPAADTLDYTLQLTRWLADGSDSLTGTPTIAISPSGDATPLDFGAPAVNGTLITWIVSGGVSGTVYTVTASIETTAGRSASFGLLLAIF